MAVTTFHSTTHSRAILFVGLAYAWSGLIVMCAFWTCFVVFLANPNWAGRYWPLPTIDSPASSVHPAVALVVDITLIALFGLQHSVMARAWFKSRILQPMPEAFQRCTYVHAANIALFTLILFGNRYPSRAGRRRSRCVSSYLWHSWLAGSFSSWERCHLAFATCWVFAKCRPGRTLVDRFPSSSRRLCFTGG
jgi:hypothetical protein